MPKQKINAEILTIDELNLLDNNPRVHSEHSLSQLTETIEEIGLARSIAIDEQNRVLAGNGTTQAARRAGLQKVLVIDAEGDTLVAVRRSDLTATDKNKLVIADNRHSENSDWNFEIVKQMVEPMVAANDLTGIGWTFDELEPLLTADFVPNGDSAKLTAEFQSFQAKMQLSNVKFTTAQMNRINAAIRLLNQKEDLSNEALAESIAHAGDAFGKLYSPKT